jgi:hypothetical protein
VAVEVQGLETVVVRWGTTAVVDIHQMVGTEHQFAALQTNYPCHNKAWQMRAEIKMSLKAS